MGRQRSPRERLSVAERADAQGVAAPLAAEAGDMGRCGSSRQSRRSLVSQRTTPACASSARRLRARRGIFWRQHSGGHHQKSYRATARPQRMGIPRQSSLHVQRLLCSWRSGQHPASREPPLAHVPLRGFSFVMQSMRCSIPIHGVRSTSSDL